MSQRVTSPKGGLEVDEKLPENESQKEYEAAVAEVLRDADAAAERAGSSPAQALLAMLLLEVSGLRLNVEEGILMRVAHLPPPGPESGEEWKGE